MNLDMNKINWLIILLLCSVFIILLISLFDHGKYYLDGYTLLNTQPTGWFFQGSYPSTATFFSFLFSMFKEWGINSSTMQRNAFDFYFVIFFFFFLEIIMILHILILYSFKANFLSILLLFILLAILSPFMATINKEIVYVILVYPIFVFFRFLNFKLFLFILVSVTTLFALGGRYYLIPFIFLSMIVYAFYDRPRYIFLFLFIALFLLYVIFPDIVGLLMIAKPIILKGITYTWIDDYFDRSQYFTFLLNSFVNSLRIMFPLELLMKGPKYFIPSLFLTYISYIAFKIISLKELYNGQKYSKLVLFSAISTIIYSIIQSIFEPDFGSVLRHKIIIIFMILIIINFYSGKYRKLTIKGVK